MEKLTNIMKGFIKLVGWTIFAICTILFALWTYGIFEDILNH